MRQGYIGRAQGKPSRYPLEGDVAEGDRVDFMPTAFVVPSPLAAPKTTVEFSWSSSFSGASATPLVESVVNAVNDIVGVALMGPSS